MNFVHVCGSLSSAAQLDPSVPDRQLKTCTNGPRSPEDETRLPSYLLASSWFLPLPPAHQTPSVLGLCAYASHYWETTVTRYLPHSLPHHLKDSPKIQLSSEDSPSDTISNWNLFSILSFSVAFTTLSHALRFTHLACFLPCQIWAPQRTRIFMMPILR